jgi:hypothetical protein
MLFAQEIVRTAGRRGSEFRLKNLSEADILAHVAHLHYGPCRRY